MRNLLFHCCQSSWRLFRIARTDEQVVEEWKSIHPDGQVAERDLNKTELPFVDLPWIAGAYTRAEQHSPEMAKALKISDELIAELESADHIVVGTPMYHF